MYGDENHDETKGIACYWSIAFTIKTMLNGIWKKPCTKLKNDK
jgi:hypothetical protein